MAVSHEPVSGTWMRSRFSPGREHDLKIAGVRADERLIQTVIEHLVAHPAEAAAAFLNAMKIGKTLGQHRITGTRAILTLAEIGQSDGRRRQTGLEMISDQRKLPA